MKTEIRYKPSFSVVFVQLQNGETITAEADAMASMDTNLGIRTRLSGGIFSALRKKIFGGESLFVNEFYVEKGNSGELVLTQNTPGDIVEYPLQQSGICLQPGAFIAYSGKIQFKTKWAGFKSWIAREGLFKLMLYGTGTVWFGAYGGVIEKNIQGEYIVDTGHLVAYEPQLKLHIQMSGGLISTFTSGEGLVSRLEGTGKVWLQTRCLPSLADWVNPLF